MGSGAGDGPGRGSGRGKAQEDVISPYMARIRQLIESHLVYPAQARQWGIQGTVHLQFDIAADGSVVSGTTVFAEDDSVWLRQGASDTLSAIGAFPPPPTGRVTVKIPVTFKRSGGSGF